MTLITDILARAARQCSVIPPSSWVTATDQTTLEIRDFLMETADDVLERIDLTGPISQTITITGTDDETYSLPADYKRLQRGEYAVYERFRTRRACVPVSDDGQWEYMKELGTAGAYRFFRVRGYDENFEIDFYRPLDTGLTAVVSYLSKNWIVNGSTTKSAFDDNSDVSMLPRRLIEAGIVFRFRERKGLEYGDKQAEYEALLARMGNDTRTRRTITFGGVNPRGPFDIPLPDFIPSS
jgi:hypothetical protein